VEKFDGKIYGSDTSVEEYPTIWPLTRYLNWLQQDRQDYYFPFLTFSGTAGAATATLGMVTENLFPVWIEAVRRSIFTISKHYHDWHSNGTKVAV